MTSAVCRRSRDQPPDRVSPALASMILGCAVLADAQLGAAAEQLEPLVASSSPSGSRSGRASILVGERVTARLARDRGRRDESTAAFARALQMFERIGARVEHARTLAEATAE